MTAYDSHRRIYRESFSLLTRLREKRRATGKGGEREIIGHSYQSEAGCSASLFLSLPFPSIRGVADRLTAIHFAARTYAHESRSHAGSRYWRGRFIQFLFIAIDLSHPLGSSINLPFVTFRIVIRNYRPRIGKNLDIKIITRLIE